ncbi:MAG TPA: DUF86 domain-containing protein [Candidatus Desulfaltia sp.]|nr:DUF86 domain-containing protein [Candidatus Desulfaltia sp.]
MTAGKINQRVITQRVTWVRQMLASLQDLPLESRDSFLKEKHTVAAAESYLRRALEALFDLGRHILVKKFAYPATEYKAIAVGLAEKNIIQGADAEVMRRMAGYRNRMVHFYQEITPEDLYEICALHQKDIEKLVQILATWAKSHQ